MKTLNDRIKELRKSKGLTQLQLSELLSVTDKAVSKWEVGEANPDISLLPKMAEIFGVTLDYLLTGKKDEDKISLDDMDSEKRIHYLIKKDNLDAFIKYGYDRPSRNNSLFASVMRFGPFDFTTINLKVWKEILAENANKILNKAFDLLLSKNNFRTSLAFLIEDIIDDLIMKAVDLDRGDVLDAIGITATKVSSKKDESYSPSVLTDRTTFMLPVSLGKDIDGTFAFVYPIIKQETLDYIFENEKNAPKCYSVVSRIGFKGDIKEEYGEVKNCYLYNVLENDIIDCAVKYGKFELIKAYVDAFAEELAGFVWSRDCGSCRVDGTYLTKGYGIVCRFYSWSKEHIEAMIAANQVEIAKSMIAHNREYSKKCEWTYLHKKSNPYIITEDEVERKARLLDAKTPESEKFILNVIKDCCIDANVLMGCRDEKLVKKILNEYPLNHYEFVYNCFKNKDMKALFKFFIDHDDASNATALMTGERGYERIMESSLERYCSVDICLDVLKAEGEPVFAGYRRITDDEAREDVLELLRGRDVFNDNPVIARIAKMKADILSHVEKAVAAAKKAEEERIEKEKVAKGLSRDYFEELLSKNNKEMFYLKLCSLLDAIFRFDYHYEGDDFSDRMNAHFRRLEESVPASRDCDDGWGYMVLDDKYEEEVVKPAKRRVKHLRDLLYRLRISRNNVAHPERAKVDELTDTEMRECLDYVFSIGGEVK